MGQCMYELFLWFWVADALKPLKRSGAGLSPLGVLPYYRIRVASVVATLDFDLGL